MDEYYDFALGDDEDEGLMEFGGRMLMEWMRVRKTVSEGTALDHEVVNKGCCGRLKWVGEWWKVSMSDGHCGIYLNRSFLRTFAAHIQLMPSIGWQICFRPCLCLSSAPTFSSVQLSSPQMCVDFVFHHHIR